MNCFELKPITNMKPNIKCLLLAAVIFSAVSCNSQKVDPIVKEYLRDSLSVLIPRCQDVLNSAYMAGTLIEERTNVPGWEGFPVQLYEYYTGKDIYLGVPKKGKVLMLNPSPEKLAKWIVNAVFHATGSLDYENIEKVRKFIKWQSGGQFPVAGVVYEDMYTVGFYEPYVFKDGVTVYIADPEMFPTDKTCTEEHLDFYITMTNDDLKPNTGRFARICSTTREMYYANGGTEAVGSSEDGQRSQDWLSVVRELYKKAWNSDTNELINAWAKANL